ncbi:MAG: tRNA (N6-isopentenyl adenosine(37)-C2)-methylthiotransferase MiaB [Lentimicrobiaceae bacterium]|nr:tRNA (N6-isopentenyl adenosine(37)-C2)-methylthiotransferase MiaB [Lentimicrobiaceae bacterium]
MNFSDSEIVGSIMATDGFTIVGQPNNADVIFVNTCSIRENAEQRIRKRLKEFQLLKKKNPSLVIGVLGCMAERLKSQLLEQEQIVDVIAGPDAYRDLPQLLNTLENGQKAMNVMLSTEETYADISPVKLNPGGVSAFISIMRGCQNFCSYCVVPYTRGKERSRNPNTIINEARELFDNGYREITLLGQNVNSYHWENLYFAGLLENVAQIDPRLRIRFTTSHPKNLSDELLYTIARYENICKSIHLPVQSGSTRILKHMNRKYTREEYMNRIEAIRRILPDCTISTDIICGFCSETEEDHKETLSIMQWVAFDYAFMFKYSERPDTLAARSLQDDVSEEIKARRLEEIIAMQRHLSLQSNKKDIGKNFSVLVEGTSKRSATHLFGRNSQNKVIVFPSETLKPGNYINVIVADCTAATLKGEILT